MKDLKKYFRIGLGLAMALVFLIVVCVYHPHRTHSKVDGRESSASVMVTPTTDEDVRYLTTKIEEVSKQNAALAKTNAFLRDKVTHSSQVQLHDAIDRLKQQISAQQQTITAMSRAGSTTSVASNSATASTAHTYPVNTGAAPLGAVEDWATPSSEHPTDGLASSSPISAQDIIHQGKEKIDHPYFTMPANSTLSDVVLMSDILAEVPINNALMQPAFKFKAIVGRKDLLASNGIRLPSDLQGIVLEGYSVGNITMSCARGYVTKMLFTWSDGHYTVVGKDASGPSLNPEDQLGYLSTPYGNPCLYGKLITDAPRIIAQMATIGGISAGADAFAQSQMSTSFSSLSPWSGLSGSAAKFAAGKTASGAAERALDWVTKRASDIFDVIYIPASRHHHPTQIVVNITRDIPIDKNIHSRSIDYEQTDASRQSFGLD